MEKGFYEEIIEEIKKKSPKKDTLTKLKTKLSKKYKLRKIPTDIDILLRTKEKDIQKVRKLLQTKPTRSLSGVAVVATMTKPRKCPHGKCTICPGGPDSDFSSPQSYTGKEPAALRGMRNKFDPYLQVFNRLEQYMVLGHNPEKVELIIMGGTFPAAPKRYQDNYITKSFQAMNDFGKIFIRNGELNLNKFKTFFELPGDIGNEKRKKSIHKKTRALIKDTTLEKEHKKNERSDIRCVALCLETRPDYAKEKQINSMLGYGTTRVEMGVQTLNDKILKKIKRGHTVQDSIDATKLMKDSFLKVCYHMMPGLPGSTLEYDEEMFKELFHNEDFMPDALKVYPCMVVEGTKLFNDWKRKKFTAITTEEAINLMTKIKPDIPEFCRIMRVQRDIPSHVITAGVDRTNLRQMIQERMHKAGEICRCIRCREVGMVMKKNKLDIKDVLAETKKTILKTIEYKASGGREIFISLNYPKWDALAGFCRLRIPNNPFRKEITENSAGIRELHVFGSAAGIGQKGGVQHMGVGKRLLQEAERIAKEDFDKKELLVISGIGVKEYYKRVGYRKKGIYVAKGL